LGELTLMFAWLSDKLQNNITFWATIITVIILIVSTIYIISKAISKKNNIKRIYACYLIPKKEYPNGVTYDGASGNEAYPSKLTVGIGLYTLFIQIHSKIDIVLDPIRISFVGDPNNKPKIEGRDNSFIREKLEDGNSRDWWGDVHKPSGDYPRPLYGKDRLMDINRICTYGRWNGKVLVEIPIRGIGKQEKLLDFIVSTNDDDIPFLKVNDIQITDKADSTTNTSRLLQ
jgi:hypothetical protein